jgi:hypothetical protein
MTLGVATAAGVRLIVWCRACRHQVEHDPAGMAIYTATKRPFSIGGTGWSVLSAEAGRSIWW